MSLLPIAVSSFCNFLTEWRCFDLLCLGCLPNVVNTGMYLQFVQDVSFIIDCNIVLPLREMCEGNTVACFLENRCGFSFSVYGRLLFDCMVLFVDCQYVIRVVVGADMYMTQIF